MRSRIRASERRPRNARRPAVRRSVLPGATLRARSNRVRRDIRRSFARAAAQARFRPAAPPAARAVRATRRRRNGARARKRAFQAVQHSVERGAHRRPSSSSPSARSREERSRASMRSASDARRSSGASATVAARRAASVPDRHQHDADGEGNQAPPSGRNRESTGRVATRPRCRTVRLCVEPERARSADRRSAATAAVRRR